MSKNRNRNKAIAPQQQQSYTYLKHTHMGRKLLWKLPEDKGGVYAGTRSDLSGRYSLVLDCTGIAPATIINKSPITAYGPNSEAYKGLLGLGVDPPTRLVIDWPDGGVPPVKTEFWDALLASVKGNLAVCCVGGHGRTGTALTALYMAQHRDQGITLNDVVGFIRANHCSEAIETEEQKLYLHNLAYYFGVEDGEGDFEPSSWSKWQAPTEPTLPLITPKANKSYTLEGWSSVGNDKLDE